MGRAKKEGKKETRFTFRKHKMARQGLCLLHIIIWLKMSSFVPNIDRNCKNNIYLQNFAVKAPLVYCSKNGEKEGG